MWQLTGWFVIDKLKCLHWLVAAGEAGSNAGGKAYELESLRYMRLVISCIHAVDYEIYCNTSTNAEVCRTFVRVYVVVVFVALNFL